MRYWSSVVCSSNLIADRAAQCGVVQVVFVDGDIGRAVIVMLDHAADVKRQHLPFALPPTAAGNRVPAVALQLGPGAEQPGDVGHVEPVPIYPRSWPLFAGKMLGTNVSSGRR